MLETMTMSRATITPSVSEFPRPITSAGRVVAALLLGALNGGVLTSGMVLAAGLIQYPPILSLQLAALALPLAIVGWLIGLVVIGGPIWWLLRKSNARPTRLAAWIGAVLAPLAAIGPPVILTFGHGDMDWSLSIQVAAFAAFGAVVGWTTARAAYGRPEVAR